MFWPSTANAPVWVSVAPIRIGGCGSAARHNCPRRHREEGEGQDAPRVAHGRWLHGGGGKRALFAASSSGHTMTFLPSCHWNITSLCAIWTPSRSTRNPPKTVLWSILRMASRSFAPRS